MTFCRHPSVGYAFFTLPAPGDWNVFAPFTKRIRRGLCKKAAACLAMDETGRPKISAWRETVVSEPTRSVIHAFASNAIATCEMSLGLVFKYLLASHPGIAVSGRREGARYQSEGPID